jgi:iron complex outermembrane recepter protein
MLRLQLLSLPIAIAVSHATLANAVNPRSTLEEVIVTAQKRETALQKTPIAISVLESQQLEAQRITGLDSLATGLIPSLRIMPYANSRSTLVMSIRGNGPTWPR